MAIKSGVYDCALAIGTEKMYVQPDPRWAAKEKGIELPEDKGQVEGARIAMAENGGGTIGNGEASMAIHIYGK